MINISFFDHQNANVTFVIYALFYRFMYEVIWLSLFPLNIYEKFRIVNKKTELWK